MRIVGEKMSIGRQRRPEGRKEEWRKVYGMAKQAFNYKEQ